MNIDTGEKLTLSKDGLKEKVSGLLDEIQTSLYERALQFRQENTFLADDYDYFREIVNGRGGFIYAHWCGESACEEQVKEETMASIRCIPLTEHSGSGACVRCAKPSPQRVYFAKAY